MLSIRFVIPIICLTGHLKSDLSVSLYWLTSNDVESETYEAIPGDRYDFYFRCQHWRWKVIFLLRVRITVSWEYLTEKNCKLVIRICLWNVIKPTGHILILKDFFSKPKTNRTFVLLQAEKPVLGGASSTNSTAKRNSPWYWSRLKYLLVKISPPIS